MLTSSAADRPLPALLAAHPYFHALSATHREAFAAHAKGRTFEADATIFLEGEPSAGLWLIESGSVKIYKLSREGQEHILHLLGPGDSFNDIAAVDGRANPASAAALSLVKAWVLPSAVLLAALQEDNELARGVIAMLTQRVRALARQIEDLTLYSSTARLARFLLRQAENPSLAAAGITRKAIAAYLATTPETVSRTLRTLQEAGAIQFDRHRIMIVDADLLRAIALL